MDQTIYPAMSTNNSSNEDGKTERITLMKLCRDNWTEWHKFFKNLLIGQGNEEVFNEKWCLDHANEKIFREKSALAFTLLHSCVSADLKPIAAAAKTFSKAMAALGKTCGKKSLIKLGNKLYALICCDYVPGSSIATHVANFQLLYTLFKSALVGKDNMKVTWTMAGIFFLKSFQNNDSQMWMDGCGDTRGNFMALAWQCHSVCFYCNPCQMILQLITRGVPRKLPW